MIHVTGINSLIVEITGKLLPPREDDYPSVEEMEDLFHLAENLKTRKGMFNYSSYEDFNVIIAFDNIFLILLFR